MKTYFDLENQQRITKHLIGLEKEKLHLEYVKKHKKHIRFLDMLVVLFILFNFGAVVITNMIVTKSEPDGIMYEINPVQAKMNGYEVHPEAKSLVTALFKQMLLWVLYIGSYIWFRMTVYTDTMLYCATVIVLFYAFLTGQDFFNNFGYWIGKSICGGVI